jgi:hypothetical protein
MTDKMTPPQLTDSEVAWVRTSAGRQAAIDADEFARGRAHDHWARNFASAHPKGYDDGRYNSFVDGWVAAMRSLRALEARQLREEQEKK